MTSRARIEESEPISPELVLVSSPELAQAVREQLSTPAPAVAKPGPDEHGELSQSVREELTTPAPAVAKPEPDEHGELSQSVREEVSTPAPAPAVAKPEPDEHAERSQSVRDELSTPAPAVAKPEPDEHVELSQSVREELSTPAPAVAKSEPHKLNREEGTEDATVAPTLDEREIETQERLQARADRAAAVPARDLMPTDEERHAELAKAVREQLSRHAELAQAVREHLSSPVPAVAKPEPDEHSAPAYEMSARPARPMPPPYPRPDITEPAPEPEPHRRRSRKVAFVVALATLAAVGGGAAFAWDHFLSSPKGTQAPALPPSEAQATTSVAPGAPTGTKPQSAGGAGAFVPGRTWVWSTNKGARAYLVRFFLNGREILNKRTAKNQLTLPRSFRYTAGGYRWSVLPVSGPPSRPSYGQPIVDSTFVLTRAAAARGNRSTP